MAAAARTYARWKAGQVEPSRVSRDTRERLSTLMGIHRSLRYLFPDPSRGYRRLRKPNLAFGGQPVLNRLLAGSIPDRSRIDPGSGCGERPAASERGWLLSPK